MPFAKRQPRPHANRLGLYAPFTLLLLAVILWSSGWLWMREQLYRGLDNFHASMTKAGYQVTWRARSVWGYPFRFDLGIDDLDIRARDGWRLTFPTVTAEAQFLSPGHWALVIPGGVALASRAGQRLDIHAKILRASLSDASAHPPRISIEAIGLALTGPATANPLFFTYAEEVHLHTRAGPDDQGAAYVEIDQAIVPKAGLLGCIADGGTVTLIVDTLFDHASSLNGSTWRAAVDRWRDDGGALHVRLMKLSAGRATLDASPGRLSVDTDGRLKGSLDVALKAASGALDAMATSRVITPDAAATARSSVDAAGPGAAHPAVLGFQIGRMMLGHAVIGTSPKVY